FRACSKFATWLTRITINQALMMIRGNTQKFVSIDEDRNIEDRFAIRKTAASYTPEQLCAQHEFEDVLLDFTKVRKSSRTVMELYINQDLSEAEISQVLRLTLSAVKARLHRGRLDLRAATSRRFRSTKLTSPAAARRSRPLAEILQEAHLVHYNGKPEQQSSWTSASELTARYSPSSCDVESCLPDHFDPQLLAQPPYPSVGQAENCL